MPVSFEIGILPNRPVKDCLELPRFQEIIDMGVHNFVWPANMPDAMHFLREFADKVIPNVN